MSAQLSSRKKPRISCGSLVVAKKPAELASENFIDNPSDSKTAFCLHCYPQLADPDLDWNLVDMTNLKSLKKSKSGYTWATQHLNLKHPGASSFNKTTSQQLLVSTDAMTTFHWLEWITQDNLPLSCVTKPLVRKHTSGN